MTVEERVAENREASKEVKIKLKNESDAQRVVEATEYDLALLKTYQTRKQACTCCRQLSAFQSMACRPRFDQHNFLQVPASICT